eukprot:TRINITY_DN1771_c0_g1_i2.p1 TRINITY_DN1771_c0_g1~~TRINITY_DN1771_c0_g1_i2.p1  ORF type:complete len:316 (+),score=26.40 TRINITY_DN1771_c0_g1_i2:44-991(+)
MVYCRCGNQLGAQARFCTSCGREYSAAIEPSSSHAPAAQSASGAGAGSAPRTTRSSGPAAAAAGWDREYFCGNIESNQESWTYRNGLVNCERGLKKNMGFKWTETQLTADATEFGHGVWDGRKAEWFFPHDDGAFWTMIYHPQQERWENTQIKWRSAVHWVWNEQDAGNARIYVEEGSGRDSIEGADTNYVKTGDVPPPVALFVAMFRRTLALRDERIERMSRGYSRCGKFCGGATVAPVLCASCSAQGPTCVVCGNGVTGNLTPGKLCKMCAIKKLFCARCGDRVGQTSAPGYLCGKCPPLGDCCKMTYQVKTM